MKQAIPIMLETAPDLLNEQERERMILKHLPQVERLAKRISNKVPANVEFSDLVSVGILGLIDAMGKYNPEQGVKFMTFAEHRIRGAMLDSLRDLDWAPRNLRTKSHQMRAVCQTLEQQMGCTATEEEKCEALGISMVEYHRRTEKMVRMNVDSLEAITDIGEQKCQSHLMRIADSPHGLPSAIYENTETHELIDAAIDDLPKKERLVVSLYYYEELNMVEIGKILGVKEARISQIHARAIRRLKPMLRRLSVAA